MTSLNSDLDRIRGLENALARIDAIVANLATREHAESLRDVLAADPETYRAQLERLEALIPTLIEEEDVRATRDDLKAFRVDLEQMRGDLERLPAKGIKESSRAKLRVTIERIAGRLQQMEARFAALASKEDMDRLKITLLNDL